MLSTAFSILVGSATLAKGMLLESRAAQSQAVCSTSFAWMDNSKGVSPCQVAASVDALCNNGNWVLQALNASVTYTNPAGSLASLCTWTINEHVSNVAIPAWAQGDPTKWPNGKFDATEAQQIASEGHPDFVGGTSTAPKKSKNVGAIVGGVIGGVVVIGVAAAIALYMIRRQRQAVQSKAAPPGDMPGHMRSLSDLSTASNVKYTSLSSNALTTNPPTSPTIMTHNTSVRSVPYMSSVVASTAPYGTATPPPGPARQISPPPVPANREDHIEPYTLPPTVDNPDRKQSNGAYVVYDPPSAPPPMRMEISRPQTPTARARYNPPAYTESSPGGSSSQRTPHRGKQPSTDSQHSLTSSRPDHSPNASGSGMANLVGQVGAINSPPREESRPSGHGRQVSASRDEKRRPPEEGFSASDIA
ncbi:hypothetical protein BDZ97DRAFT_1752438 [Flammula alnicola]|nr:hypothetical protein BDZ97DRAFT_1752438 [Flammula alnicola]